MTQIGDEVPSEDDVNRNDAAEERVRARIREVMGRQRVTQAEMVRRTGIGRTAMSRLLKGEQRLNIATVWALAGALGVEPSSLLIDHPGPGLSEREAELIGAVRREGGEAVLRALEGLLPQAELAYITASTFSDGQRDQLLGLMAELSAGLKGLAHKVDLRLPPRGDDG